MKKEIFFFGFLFVRCSETVFATSTADRNREKKPHLGGIRRKKGKGVRVGLIREEEKKGGFSV